MKQSHFAWAWAPYLDEFLRLGWMVVANAHEERSGHPSFLVEWPCDCIVRFPRKEAHVSEERTLVFHRTLTKIDTKDDMTNIIFEEDNFSLWFRSITGLDWKPGDTIEFTLSRYARATSESKS